MRLAVPFIVCSSITDIFGKVSANEWNNKNKKVFFVFDYSRVQPNLCKAASPLTLFLLRLLVKLVCHAEKEI